MTEQERQAILAMLPKAGAMAMAGVVLIDGERAEPLRRARPGDGTYLVLFRPNAASTAWPEAAWRQHVQLQLTRAGVHSSTVVPLGAAGGYACFFAADGGRLGVEDGTSRSIRDIKDGTSNTLGMAEGTSRSIRDIKDGTSNTLGITDGTSNTMMLRGLRTGDAGSDAAAELMLAAHRLGEVNQSFNVQVDRRQTFTSQSRT